MKRKLEMAGKGLKKYWVKQSGAHQVALKLQRGEAPVQNLDPKRDCCPKRRKRRELGSSERQERDSEEKASSERADNGERHHLTPSLAVGPGDFHEDKKQGRQG